MIIFDLSSSPLNIITGCLGMLPNKGPYTAIKDSIVVDSRKGMGAVTQSKQSKEIATDDNTSLTSASSVHALTSVTAKGQATSYFDAHEVKIPAHRYLLIRTSLEHTSSVYSRSSAAKFVATDTIVFLRRDIPHLPGAWPVAESVPAPSAPADPSTTSAPATSLSGSASSGSTLTETASEESALSTGSRTAGHKDDISGSSCSHVNPRKKFSGTKALRSSAAKEVIVPIVKSQATEMALVPYVDLRTRYVISPSYRLSTRSHNNPPLAYVPGESQYSTGPRSHDLAQAENDSHEQKGELILRWDELTIGKSLIRTHGFDLLVHTLPLFWSSGLAEEHHTLSYLALNFKIYLHAFLLGVSDALTPIQIPLQNVSSALTRSYHLKNAIMIWLNRQYLPIERVIRPRRLIVSLDIDAAQLQIMLALVFSPHAQHERYLVTLALTDPSSFAQLVIDDIEFDDPDLDYYPSRNGSDVDTDAGAHTDDEGPSEAGKTESPSTNLQTDAGPSKVADVSEAEKAGAPQGGDMPDQVNPAQPIDKVFHNSDSDVERPQTEPKAVSSDQTADFGADATTIDVCETEKADKVPEIPQTVIDQGRLGNVSGAEQTTVLEDVSPSSIDRVPDDKNTEVVGLNDEPKADSSGLSVGIGGDASTTDSSKTEKIEKFPEISQTDADYDQLDSASKAEKAVDFESDNTLVDSTHSINKISGDLDSEPEKFNGDSDSDRSTLVEDDAGTTITKTKKAEEIPKVSQTFVSHGQVESVSGAEMFAPFKDDPTHRQSEQVTEAQTISLHNATGVEHRGKESGPDSREQTTMAESQADNTQLTQHEEMWLEAYQAAEMAATASPKAIHFPFRMRGGPRGTITTCKDLVAEGRQAQGPLTPAHAFSSNPSKKRTASDDEVLESSPKRRITEWNTPTDVMNFSDNYASGELVSPNAKKRTASEDLVQEKTKSPRIIRPMPRAMRKKTLKVACPCPALDDLERLCEENKIKKQAAEAWGNNMRDWYHISALATGRRCLTDYSVNPPRPYDSVAWRQPFWGPPEPPCEAYLWAMEVAEIDEIIL